MQRFKHYLKVVLFFLAGCVSASIVLLTLAYILFSIHYRDRIYYGVQIEDIDASELTKSQLDSRLSLFPNKNIQITLTNGTATISSSSRELGLKPDIKLMTDRAFSVGRQTNNPYYNLLQILSARSSKIVLPLEIKFNQNALDSKISPLGPLVEKPAVNALYKFDSRSGPDGKGRVVAFSPSSRGISIDKARISQQLIIQAKAALFNDATRIYVPLYTKSVIPTIETSTADNIGIKTLIGHGESFFYDSIPTRVYNIQLGTQKVSGRLIAPGEIFSFDDSIGTISALFGFQKAYSIIQGKTVLDDGGGVCQVSTTIYRAALNAGLPIIERAAHAYRVAFYEEGGFLPGMDATVYPPNLDFRFKNDTGNWILLQATFDGENHKLSFDIFGTDDGRKTQIQGPYIVSTSPPGDPIYEDDPTKPIGTITQTDTPHYGANVYFTRKVTRDDQILIDETVKSNYIPWPARFLKGTKT